MIISILGGIQANLPALNAVKEQIEAINPDAVYVLGDLVGYGAEPAEVIDTVREAGWHCVGGIWDYAVSRTDWDDTPLNPRANCSRWWTRGALSKDHRQWLSELPTEIVDSEAKLQFVHASPAADQTKANIFSTEDAQDAMQSAKANTVFFGHTNVPMAFIQEADNEMQLCPGVDSIDLAGKTNLVNVGSVGQPRDNDPRACFALYDTATETLTWNRVEYDIKAEVAAIHDSGLPTFFAERLTQGR